MRTRNILVLAFYGLLVGIIVFGGCDSTEDVAEYTLTVILGEGVSGIPAAGTYTHAENDVVTYSYSAQAGYGNLTATLDGASIPASGTLTVSGNHILNVTADIDLRGTWRGRFYAGWDSYFQATISGGTLSGTVQSHIDIASGTGTGNFTVTGNQIEFNLQFPLYSFVFSGSIEGVNHLSGEWRLGTTTSFPDQFPKKIPGSGTWVLDRD